MDKLKSILNYDKKDTVLIFGCSEAINTINIPELLENYTSIGLNDFSIHYPCDYFLWIDRPDLDNAGKCIFKKIDGEFKPYLKFEPNVDLHGAFTVASFALDFAIKEGFKRAILFGIMDGEYTLLEKRAGHVGHWIFSYKYFYTDEVKTISMFKIQQFKNIIKSYANRIEIIKGITNEKIHI